MSIEKVSNYQSARLSPKLSSTAILQILLSTACASSSVSVTQKNDLDPEKIESDMTENAASTALGFNKEFEIICKAILDDPTSKTTEPYTSTFFDLTRGSEYLISKHRETRKGMEQCQCFEGVDEQFGSFLSCTAFKFDKEGALTSIIDLMAPEKRSQFVASSWDPASKKSSSFWMGAIPGSKFMPDRAVDRCMITREFIQGDEFPQRVNEEKEPKYCESIVTNSHERLRRIIFGKEERVVSKRNERRILKKAIEKARQKAEKGVPDIPTMSPFDHLEEVRLAVGKVIRLCSYGTGEAVKNNVFKKEDGSKRKLGATERTLANGDVEVCRYDDDKLRYTKYSKTRELINSLALHMLEGGMGASLEYDMRTNLREDKDDVRNTEQNVLKRKINVQSDMRGQLDGKQGCGLALHEESFSSNVGGIYAKRRKNWSYDLGFYLSSDVCKEALQSLSGDFLKFLKDKVMPEHLKPTVKK